MTSVSDEEARRTYPDGWRAPRPYLRIVPQPGVIQATAERRPRRRIRREGLRRRRNRPRTAARRDHRPVAARAVDDGWAGAVKLVDALHEAGQRHIQCSGDRAVFQFAGIAHIEHHQIGDLVAALHEFQRGEPGAAVQQHRDVRQRSVMGSARQSDHIVETDPAEADLGLEFSSRRCQDHDPLLGQQHRTRVLGEPSFETNVYRSPKMRRREVLRPRGRRVRPHLRTPRRRARRKRSGPAAFVRRAVNAAARLRCASNEKYGGAGD